MDEMMYSPIEMEILDMAAEEEEESIDDFTYGDLDDSDAIDVVADDIIEDDSPFAYGDNEYSGDSRGHSYEDY